VKVNIASVVFPKIKIDSFYQRGGIWGSCEIKESVSYSLGKIEKHLQVTLYGPNFFLILNNPIKYSFHMSKGNICVYTNTIHMICFSPWELNRANCWYHNPIQNSIFVNSDKDWKKIFRQDHHQVGEWLLIIEERFKRQFYFYTCISVPYFLVMWSPRSKALALCVVIVPRNG
jgi:hypothetical protein